MGQPRIVEVDYYTFRTKLKAAAAAGFRIEKTDGDRWQDYVKARKVDLYGIQAWTKVRFMGEEIKLAIIDGEGDWDGVYAWSEEDERVARWESGEEPEAAAAPDSGESANGQEAAASASGEDAAESGSGQDAGDGPAGRDPEESLS